MVREKLLLNNSNKIIFLVLDGLGDIPHPAFSYTTPLEAARKPNIDHLAVERGILGRILPVDVGITPGSGPAHLSLFGYDPLEHEIGRGVLETLGLNMDLQRGDLAARANFCTVKDGLVKDRRAGRIATEETERLCGMIQEAIPSSLDAGIIVKPGKSHRFAIIFRGEGLSDRLADADPHKDERPYLFARPTDKEAEHAAAVVNGFLKRAAVLLKDEAVANGVLLRGFSSTPAIPSFVHTYGMRALAIATYPMYRGVAKVIGMDVGGEPATYNDVIDILKENYQQYDFFFIHIKETDLAGEDGNFPAKVRAIEDVDALVPSIAGLFPEVLVITGDHATPCLMKGHSWHPVPLLIVAAIGESDRKSFNEKNCLSGSIGTIRSKELMSLALAYGLKLDKYGA
jgi:2,3-bisphosphoglycerate-independent phosphoglycerate mutase